MKNESVLVDIKCVKNITDKGKKLPLTIGRIYRKTRLEYTKGITKDGVVYIVDDSGQEDYYSMEFFRVEYIYFIN